MQGRANEGDALKVWRENRPRRNSGNRAGMIKQYTRQAWRENQAGEGHENKQNTGKRAKDVTKPRKHMQNTHAMKLK